jgi:transposase
LRVDVAARDVIQAPKPEPQIMRYELSDYEWSAIKPMLPNKPRGVRRVNDRRVLNGIFWVLRSGAPWRDLPEAYGPRTTCYNRFIRWRLAGVWDQIMDRLKRSDEALNELRRATELDPGQARYAYVYAVALHSAGRGNEALAALRENLVRHPNDRDTLLALISFSRESGDISFALEYAERLQQIAADAPGLTGWLIQDLRRQTAKPIAQ